MYYRKYEENDALQWLLESWMTILTLTAHVVRCRPCKARPAAQRTLNAAAHSLNVLSAVVCMKETQDCTSCLENGTARMPASGILRSSSLLSRTCADRLKSDPSLSHWIAHCGSESAAGSQVPSFSDIAFACQYRATSKIRKHAIKCLCVEYTAHLKLTRQCMWRVYLLLGEYISSCHQRLKGVYRGAGLHSHARQHS